jgi:hypothetical protein
MAVVPSSSHRDPVQHGHEIGNRSRNERQKSVLLCEVGKLRRDQVSDAVSNSKALVEKSKKLCAKTKPAATSQRKRAG